ncbi:MAG TPA: ABC transporter permease [Candidatus Bathyarchaeia archaeon]|nr:ABC transporter permease [Candidatus Bathyarchaeia archaeon]
MLSFKRITADLRVFVRGYTRNKVGLFFSLIFPIILILLFGAIFSGGNTGPINVYVQNQDGGTASNIFVQYLNNNSTTKVTIVDKSQVFSQYLLDHSANQGVLIPQNFTQLYLSGEQVNVTVYSNPADTSSPVVIETVGAIINQMNLRGATVLYHVGLQQNNIKSQSYKYIDFLIPGLVGFSVLTSPMFSLVNISSEYKKTKLFKQLSLTPLTKTEWLTSKIIWYVVLGVFSFFLMTQVGAALFGAHLEYSFAVIPFLILGPLFFVSLGMLVGMISKSVESAAVVGNLITFPMMFLSGTFFPVSLMPAYLQNIAHVLPLFYLIDGLNQVMIYTNLAQALFDVELILVISAVVFVLAVVFFKWRED